MLKIWQRHARQKSRSLTPPLMAARTKSARWSPGVIEEPLRHVKEEAEKHLVEIANSFKAKGIRANYVYQEEMPALESIAYAEKDNGDLIAPADHGKGEVAWIFGGVASTDDLKRTSLTNTNWVIAVVVGLLISISPLLIAMLFM